MHTLLSFKNYELYRENARRTGSKTVLYPLGYAGIGLYPDADYMTHAADAVLYLSIDKRLYHNGDKAPFDIRHIPGHKQYGDKVNNGDSVPFDITKVPGKPTPHSKLPSDGIVKFKDFIKLVQKPDIVSPQSKSMPK